MGISSISIIAFFFVTECGCRNLSKKKIHRNTRDFVLYKGEIEIFENFRSIVRTTRSNFWF